MDMETPWKIYTHVNVDLDAVASVWAVRKFVPGFENAVIVTVPANWDGAGLQQFRQVAVDINAGGKGIKGEKDPDGTIHSCFVSLLQTHANADANAALFGLATFIDAQDSKGNAVQALVPDIAPDARDIISSVTINAVLRIFQNLYPRNDLAVIEKMGELFDGFLAKGLARLEAIKEADEQEILPSGNVAIVRNAKHFATSGVLMNRGVKFVVFVDGNNLGIARAGGITTRADHALVRRAIEDAGESIGDSDGTWFAHPAGFVFAWGTRKAPAKEMSAVDPKDLALAISVAVNEDSILRSGGE